MRSFGRYLWKEWRDQRTIVVAIALAVPALLLLAKAVGVRMLFRQPGLPAFTAFSAFGIVALSLGGDLIAGEDRRGTLAFLRRMPNGLAQAHLAKTLVYLVALALAAVWGWACATALLDIPDAPGQHVQVDVNPLFVIVPALALLAYLVSGWLPRGALAMPGGALLALLVVAPAILLAFDPWTKSWALRVRWLPVVVAFAALPVGWLAWTRGRRFGRGPWGAAWRGLLLLALVASPLWAREAHRTHLARTIDIGAADFRITSAFLGEGCRHAYVNAQRVIDDEAVRGAVHPLRVDLVTGEAIPAGHRGDAFVEATPPWHLRVPLPGVVQIDATMLGERRVHNWLRVRDAATGEPVDEGWDDLQSDAMLRTREAIVRATSPVRLADGRRAWIWRDAARADAPDGGIEDLYRFDHVVSNWPIGHGWVVDANHVLDANRRRVFPSPGASPVVRAGRWLVSNAEGSYLLDPERREKEAVEVERALALPDGRLLVLERGRWYVWSPEGDMRRELPLEARHASFRSLTPASRPVLLAWSEGTRFVRLDPETLELASTARTAASALGCPDEDHVIAVDDRRIVRLAFDGSPAEVLWPKEGAR